MPKIFQNPTSDEEIHSLNPEPQDCAQICHNPDSDKRNPLFKPWTQDLLQNIKQPQNTRSKD
jgi:hypothetical protein